MRKYLLGLFMAIFFVGTHSIAFSNYAWTSNELCFSPTIQPNITCNASNVGLQVSDGGNGSKCNSSTTAIWTCERTSTNAVCGSSDGGTYSSKPTTALCSTGTAGSVTGNGPWNWTCSGVNGGSDASCTANKRENAVCGSSDGGSYSSKPTSNLCNSGTAGNVTGNGPWNWTCSGVNGGSDASCMANKKEDAVCGSASNGDFYTIPTIGLCNNGTAGNVTGNGPWNWTCSGVNGGSDASCTANKKEDAVCGPSDEGTYSSKPTTGLCNNGTAGSVTGNGPWDWTCSGINGGSDASCMANKKEDAVCGSASNGDFYTVPTTGLCNNGTAGSVTGNGPWNWTCSGINGGSDASCTANKKEDAVCGSSDGGTYFSKPTTGLCSNGTAGNVTGNGPWNWTCSGVNGGNDISCKAIKIINGRCGSSHGTKIDDISIGGLCSEGNAIEIKGNGPWIWKCKGSNGGTSSFCRSGTGGSRTGPIPIIKQDPNVSVEVPITKKVIKKPLKPKNIPIQPKINKKGEDKKSPKVKKKYKEIVSKPFKFYEKIGKTLIKKYPKLLLKTGSKFLKGIKTLESNHVQTSVNQEDFRLAGQYNIDINFWKQVLPEIDKNSKKILVIPSSGLVVPIVEVKKGTQDYDNALNGLNFSYLDIMKNGAVEYPGSSTGDYGEIGNKVVFGHSSYWKKSRARYKTHFQKIIELNFGEEIWIYSQGVNGQYKRYIYSVQNSYETLPDDVDIMKPGIGRRLTLVTCTPIGGISGRWIVSAELKEDVELKNTLFLERLKISLYKKIIRRHIVSIMKKDISNNEKKKQLGKLYLQLTKNSKKNNDEKLNKLFSYFKREILKSFRDLSK